ncbi:MAG: hypothetical protein A2782_00955 [Candidatus Blackburnbacteria bacterium RIFCSPHIGHO2_01_FULL_43_15b]|uniref:Uncharacterized protein n=1 Tax=Candidatus Blackburnbacteria bacterium RIFCSPHIGHO2_01_FULL_43_15b TaxID=1797513 RepID=A0A1G1V149_9BACT|nr:MAG: hypothetical protein A2782_00955 [Candidatus Blackburnbacteria bacterium RIFCSPHIGHO2_01_FULL_43_15b]
MDDTAQTRKAQIRSKLKLRHLAAKSSFAQKHPHAKSFFDNSGIDLGKIRQHSTKLLTAGAISGALLLPAVSHFTPLPPTSTTIHREPKNTNNLMVPLSISGVVTSTGPISSFLPRQFLVGRLAQVLPPIVDRFSPHISYEAEKIAAQIVSRATGIPAKASLEGERLNTTYGYIGIEQHLARYPGDSIAKHGLPKEGMAPGLGGFGYFNMASVLTQDAITREKYYVVSQLMYLPDWGKRTRYLANWYKWRKMIVVNPDNGNAVVGDLGDAGPAAWTGKQFGGSPEVMDALGGHRYTKGRVLFFFVDDAENKIPLGPVKYDEISSNIMQAI